MRCSMHKTDISDGRPCSFCVATIAEIITKLTKERDLYNARRKEAMKLCEQHRNRANRYEEALKKIRDITRGILPPSIRDEKIELTLYRALDNNDTP